MEVDFFLAQCKTVTTHKVFGLCDDDDKDSKEEPAYLSELAEEKDAWIAHINNKDEKTVTFYAIDHCVPMKKEKDKNKDESRCDGLLVEEETFYNFIELKNRKLKGSEWRQTGKDQLKITIEEFQKNYPNITKQHIKAYLCNKKQLTTIVYQESQDNFLEDTGIVLEIKRVLDL